MYMYIHVHTPMACTVCVCIEHYTTVHNYIYTEFLCQSVCCGMRRVAPGTPSALQLARRLTGSLFAHSGHCQHAGSVVLTLAAGRRLAGTPHTLGTASMQALLCSPWLLAGGWQGHCSRHTAHSGHCQHAGSVALTRAASSSLVLYQLSHKGNSVHTCTSVSFSSSSPTGSPTIYVCRGPGGEEGSSPRQEFTNATAYTTTIAHVAPESA